MKPIITLLFAFLAINAGAQEIFGKIVNENGSPVIIGAVLVKQNGVLKDVAYTDFYGDYTTKSLEPGNYDIIAFYNCYDTVTLMGVPVLKGEKTVLNISLNQSDNISKNTVRPYKKLLTEDISNHESNATKTMVVSDIIICRVGISYIDMDIDNPTSFKMNKQEITRLPY